MQSAQNVFSTYLGIESYAALLCVHAHTSIDCTAIPLHLRGINSVR